MTAAEPSPPSALYLENADRVRQAARRRPVVDLACGRGRHALAAARAGLAAIALDRSGPFLGELMQCARREGSARSLLAARCDLEAESGIPLRPASCGAILVFRFLFRPLAPQIEACLAPGGLLLYETFTTAQRDLGWGPRNPDFLLEPGELPGLFPGLEVLSHDERVSEGERPEAVARLVARKPAAP